MLVASVQCPLDTTITSQCWVVPARSRAQWDGLLGVEERADRPRHVHDLSLVDSNQQPLFYIRDGISGLRKIPFPRRHIDRVVWSYKAYHEVLAGSLSSRCQGPPGYVLPTFQRKRISIIFT